MTPVKMSPKKVNRRRGNQRLRYAPDGSVMKKQTSEEKNTVRTIPSEKLGDMPPGAELGMGGLDFLTLLSQREDIPDYWTNWRDKWLRDFAFNSEGNDVLRGVIETVAAKVATTRWVLEGPERTVNTYQKILLQRSGFGAGWGFDTMRGVVDYLTQDKGWSRERIRRGKTDRQGACIGLAHFDSQRVGVTLDPDWPARYYDIDNPTANDGPIPLHRSQVQRIVDMPSPSDYYRGIGYCAVSRAITTARILALVAKYEYERLSDLPPAGILLINNMTRKQWRDVTADYDVSQRQQGNQVWRDILVAFGLDPALPLSMDLFSFSSLPEHFNKREMTEIAIFSFALAFNIDVQEIWAVAGARFGTATEAEIQHTKAKGKGSGLILTQIERSMNDGLTLPPTVTFKFDYTDGDEDMLAAQIATEKAKFVSILAGTLRTEGAGTVPIIPQEVAQKYLVREGLFDLDELATAEVEETASDEGIAKTLDEMTWKIDMGPRTRIDSNGKITRLEYGPQVWAISKKVGDDGKVDIAGRPLSQRSASEVDITPEDVALAMRKWDAEMPVEYRGLLAATPGVDAA